MADQAPVDPWADDPAMMKAAQGKPAPPGGDDDWKLWQQGAAKPQQSMLQKVGSTVGDLATGAFKGASRGIDDLSNTAKKYIPGLSSLDSAYWKAQGKDPNAAGADYTQAIQPSNTAQAIGGGLEKAAEFLIPGRAEEAGAAKLAEMIPQAGKYAAPLARMASSAVGSGAVNAAQGGSFGAGAAMGAGGSAVGSGLEAMAPGAARFAMGIRKGDKAFGKTPGEALLNDTRGFSPATVAKTGQQTLDRLNPQLNADYAAAPGPASPDSARQVILNAMAKARQEKNPVALQQLQPLLDHLTSFEGQAIPSQMSPADLLNLKRGFGKARTSWSPETSPDVQGTARQAYHALDKEGDRVVPTSEQLNQRISSLIPAVQRAESTSRNATIPEKVMHRMAAHTGAAIGGIAGADAGYNHGGLPGAMIGGVAGAVLPEVATSPAMQMMLARGMASPITRKIVLPMTRGGLLQSDR